jgi:hypothetical protein
MKKFCVMMCGVVCCAMLFAGCSGSGEQEGKETKADETKAARSAGEMTETGFVAETIIIDDFDGGAKPNKLGGDLGAWDRDPNDQTQTCQMTYDSSVKNGESGFSIRLDYDVESPNPAYNGFWTKLENLNASKHKNLVMWVKGDGEKGFTEKFKVELKSAKETGVYTVTGVNDTWQKIVIPLERFAGLTDRSALTELVIVFDDTTSTERFGSINLDDMYFE